MSTAVHFCPLFSMSYRSIGNTLSQQLFHLLCASIPEMNILSPDDHPSPSLPINRFPDDR